MKKGQPASRPGVRGNAHRGAGHTSNNLMREPERRTQPLLVAQWKYLWSDEFVELRHGGRVNYAGWVDDVTADGTVIWILLKGGLGRVMIHHDDGLDIWRVDSRVLQDRSASPSGP